MFFDGVLGLATNTISATSRVRFSKSKGSPCIIALSQTETGVRLNGGAQLITPNCSVHALSTNNPAAAIESGVQLDVQEVCIAGSNIINNYGEDEKIKTECETVNDPYAGLYPVPDDLSCDHNNKNFNTAEEFLEPGVYCGYSNFNRSNGIVNFEPGLYVIRNGGWNVNGGDWRGDGVTFYFADQSKIQFNSGVKASMSAPKDGDYANVFMTEAPGLNRSDIVLNDSRGFDVEGIVYLPNRDMMFNSGSQIRSLTMNLVVNTLTVGSGILSLETVKEGSDSSFIVTPYIAN